MVETKAVQTIKELNTIVTDIRDYTHDIKGITLQLPEGEELDFKAGQFVQFFIPPYGQLDKPIFRTYSIASPPSSKNRIDLIIRYVPNGVATTYIFNHLKVGESIRIKGAFGRFFLRDCENDILFIAGGSGMSAVLSIILEMYEKGCPRQARCFFGAVSGRDLYLLDEMKEIEKKMPNFSFIPALSCPTPEDNWNGETGLITEVVDRHVKSGDTTDAYLCGSPGMIDACIEVLHRKGIPDSRIFFDKFVTPGK
ncbi:MAG: FAD-binding oxidoreductase [Firmicutes bacterium]|nr:FAD-binding oxidoreductase [Bacillota bacterium]